RRGEVWDGSGGASKSARIALRVYADLVTPGISRGRAARSRPRRRDPQPAPPPGPAAGPATPVAGRRSSGERHISECGGGMALGPGCGILRDVIRSSAFYFFYGSGSPAAVGRA